MNIREVFVRRRSVRKFSPKEVPDKDIEEIIGAAALAPTARNIQPWEFLVVSNKDTLKEIARLASPNGAFIAGAPACIAVFCQETKYYLEDGCAATTQALLCATSLGLGTCWVAGDKKDYCENIRQLLSVPPAYKLVSLIALGYPAESPTVQKRGLKEILHKERF